MTTAELCNGFVKNCSSSVAHAIFCRGVENLKVCYTLLIVQTRTRSLCKERNRQVAHLPISLFVVGEWKERKWNRQRWRCLSQHLQQITAISAFVKVDRLLRHNDKLKDDPAPRVPTRPCPLAMDSCPLSGDYALQSRGRNEFPC